MAPAALIPVLFPRRSDIVFKTRLLSRRGAIGNAAHGVDAAEDTNVPLIVGISIGVFVAVVMAVLLGYFLLRARRKNDARREAERSERIAALASFEAKRVASTGQPGGANGGAGVYAGRKVRDPYKGIGAASSVQDRLLGTY